MSARAEMEALIKRLEEASEGSGDNLYIRPSDGYRACKSCMSRSHRKMMKDARAEVQL